MGTAQRARSVSVRRGQAADTRALRASRTAMDQLSTLTGRDADSVSRLERTEDGWLLNVEVVELERIPQSTSVLGSYQVHTDTDGNITAYQRTRRYYRNQAGDP
jgi:Gas vesicle synthesis protein GvpO.